MEQKEIDEAFAASRVLTPEELREFREVDSRTKIYKRETVVKAVARDVMWSAWGAGCTTIAFNNSDSRLIYIGICATVWVAAIIVQICNPAKNPFKF